MGISIRAYGRHRGVSDAAVRKAIKAGRITAEPDGTIDPERADAEWKRNTDVAQQRGEQKRKAPDRKAVPQAALNAVSETLTEHGTPGGGTTYMQARAANEVLKAQTARIRLQQLKKELVDRSKALAHVFRLARQERDAWISWPARVSATMAAELSSKIVKKPDGSFEVDAHTLHVTLEHHVREHLAELADLKPRVD
ncbi:MAG: elements of external origin [Proteobacteria bacterium]|nr:MAG: elements of external origin [Pseudomonadota bacterium]